MRKWIFVVLAFFLFLCNANAWMLVTGGGGATQTSPGGDLVIVNLDHDTSTSNPCSTASLTPTAGSMLIVSAAAASSGSVSDIAVTGGGLSWTQLDFQVYGARRAISVWRGTGTYTSGALTITVSLGFGDYQETMFSVEQVTGFNASDPDDAAVSAEGDDNLNLPDVGTPGTGDMIFSIFAHEDGANNFNFTSGITELAREAAGANVRQIITGYECDASMDETPGVTSSGGTNAIGGIAFIVNGE